MNTSLVSRIAFAILLGGCKSPPRTVKVEIRNFKFEPAEVTLRKGDSLAVTNHDVVPHTATELGKKWDTGSISADSTRTIEITQSGKFFCAFHPTMTGKVRIDGD